MALDLGKCADVRVFLRAWTRRPPIERERQLYAAICERTPYCADSSTSWQAYLDLLDGYALAARAVDEAHQASPDDAALTAAWLRSRDVLAAIARALAAADIVSRYRAAQGVRSAGKAGSRTPAA